MKLRSKFLDNFQTLASLDETYWPMVRGLEKVIAATIFLDDGDAHMGNIGVIKKDEELYAAKIDHGAALHSLEANGGVWKQLNSMYSIGYSKFALNIKEFQDAFNEMAQISDEEIERLAGRGVQELSKLGLLPAKPPVTSKEVIANTILGVKQVIQNNKREVQYFLNALGPSQSPDSPSRALQVSELINNPKWNDGLWIHADIDYHDIDLTSKRRALETLRSKLELKNNSFVWPDYLEAPAKFTEAKRLVDNEFDEEIVKHPMNAEEAQAASARIDSRAYSITAISYLEEKIYDAAFRILSYLGPKILPGELELDAKILGYESGIINFAASSGLSYKNKDHLPIFEALFRAGASVEKAQRYIKESPELAMVAIRNDRDNTPLASALKSTSVQSGIKIINQLLSEGADPNERNKDGALPIHIAKVYNIEALKLLINDPRTDINAPDKNGETILHTLVRRRVSDLCTELLKEEKYNLDMADNKGETILHIAVRNNDEAMINTIIKNERFHNFGAPNSEGKTALALAQEKGMGSIVLLLESEGAAAIAKSAQKAEAEPLPIPAQVLEAAVAAVSPKATEALAHHNPDRAAAAGADVDYKPPSPGSLKRLQPGYKR